MSRMYVLDDEFQLSIALAQKALDDTVIPFQRHGRSCDPWVVGEACQEDHWPIHGWPSPWDVWEVPGFKSMTVRVDLNLSLSCSRLTTLLHLRLGCILMMITAVANDGLLRVHGMKEQLGFHCWKAHYEACVLNLLSTDILNPDFSEVRRQPWILLPHWTAACPFGSDVVVACRHVLFCMLDLTANDFLFCIWLTQVGLGENPGQCRQDSGHKEHEWCHWGCHCLCHCHFIFLNLIYILLFIIYQMNLNLRRRTCLSTCTRQWPARCARYSHGLIVPNHSWAPCENDDLVQLQPFISDCDWQWQNSILNAMPFSLRYGRNREGVSADQRIHSWNRWLYGDLRCWGGLCGWWLVVFKISADVSDVNDSCRN